MKAVLVIDEMPENCRECRYRCFEASLRDKYRPSWCPLRPLPQKKEVEVNEIDDIMHTEYSIEDIYTNKYIATIRLATDKLISLGWNACLDYITGDEE